MRILFSFLLFICTCLSLHGSFPENEIKEKLQRFRSNNGIPGLAVAILYNDKPYFFNFGQVSSSSGIPISEHTIFDIASITKSFTATLLALQVERGMMRLHDHIDQYLPFVYNHPSLLSKITLEQLASHTASLEREAPLKRGKAIRKRILRSLLSWQPPYQIGSKFKYSNLGFALLGFCLENNFHMPYGQIVRSQIAEPLGMNDTYLHVPAPYYYQYTQGFSKTGFPVKKRNRSFGYAAAGGLKSSTSDLMKFMMANNGLTGSQELIKAMSLAQKGVFRANPNMVQGLSWQNFSKNGVEMIDKNGGLPGFSSWMGWVPAEHSPSHKAIGVVILSNKRSNRVTPFGRQLLTRLVKTQRP